MDGRTLISMMKTGSRSLALVGAICERLTCGGYAYCLMDNHYHLVMERPDGNLARGMRQLNEVYTQCFNARHG